MYRHIKNLKKMVELVLRDYPETRNDDIVLTKQIWISWFSHYITDIGGERFVKLQYLSELPREDNIKRIRASLQNEHHIYLPTIESVARKRKLNIDEWRGAMGYPTMGTSGTGAPSFVPPSEGLHEII
jgi:hypothetical protein